MSTSNGTLTSNEDAITCTTCKACCCRLEVILMGDDDVPLALTAEDRWGGSVMRRLDDGWCVAVDRNTMKCTIYTRRPGVCRDYLMGDSECISEQKKFLHPVTILPIRDHEVPE